MSSGEKILQAIVFLVYCVLWVSIPFSLFDIAKETKRTREAVEKIKEHTITVECNTDAIRKAAEKQHKEAGRCR